jgi:hypothetical protein
MQVASNGVMSNEAAFRADNGLPVAIMNLVVVMEQGQIKKLEWSNDCYGSKVCSSRDCV